MNNSEIAKALEAARDTFNAHIASADIPSDDNATLEVVVAVQKALNAAIRTLGEE